MKPFALPVKGPGRTAILLALFLSAVLCTSWLLVFYHLPGQSQFEATLQNSGHALIFLCLSLILSALLKKQWPALDIRLLAAIAALLCVFIGGIVEVIQARVGRDSSWLDLRLDTAGAVAGSALFLSFYGAPKAKFLLRGVAALLMLYSLSSPLMWLYAGYQRDAAFPVIADFDNPWLNKFIDTKYSARFSIVSTPAGWEGNPTTNVARVDFDTGPWPGLLMRSISGDWRDYHYFVFEVFNPGLEELQLVLRINDRQHNNRHADRFNRTFAIKPGYHQLKVPLDDVMRGPKERRMDMRRVFAAMVYMSRPKQRYTLYFDNFRLESSE